MKRLNV